MKFNRYFIFIIFLMLILSVSAVNAADNLNNNSINTGEAILPASTAVDKNWTVDEFLNNYNTIQDNEVVLIQNGTGTPNGNVILNQNGITIFTEGNVIFDGQGKDMYFEITGDNVLIKGITFKNFKFTEDGRTTLSRWGGAVSWIGDNGTLINSTFNNNTASSEMVNGGGAVSWIGDNGTLINSTFNNNSYFGHVDYNGGGICWMGDNGTLINSTFNNNTSHWNGGGVCWVGDNGTLTGSTFNNNAAYGEINNGGGGVCWMGDNGTLINSTFNNNSVSSYGAGVYWRGDNGTLTGSTFNNNAASGFIYMGMIVGEASGGGVYWDGANGTLTRSIFINNSAIYYGGAVYWYFAGSISNCSFINCTSVNSNGIYAVHNLTIDGGNGIVYVLVKDILSGISISVLNNETLSVNSNQIVNLTGKIVSGDLIIIDNTADVFKFKVDGKEITDKAVKISSNGEYYMSYTSDVPANLSIAGSYAKSSADTKYKNGTLIFKELAKPDIKVSVKDIAYGDNATVTVTLNANANGSVTINVAGKSKTINIVNGKAEWTVSGLAAGLYAVTVTYDGDNDFAQDTATAQFTVGPAYVLEADDIVKCFRNGTQYQVTLKDHEGNPIAGAKIAVTFVNGKGGNPSKYTLTTNGNGVATLSINANPGTYFITADYADKSVSSKITVLKPISSSPLSAEDINMALKDGSKYTVKAFDSNGKPVVGEKVSISITSPKWNKPANYNVVTDKDGIARLPIGLAAGQYSFTAKYGSNVITTKVNVLSQSYIIKVKDITKYYKNGTQYTVTVKDLKGNLVANKAVSVILNSPNWKKPLTYKLTTNAKGVASLTINLAPGQYTVKAAIGDNVATSSVRVLSTLTTQGLTKPVNQPGKLVAKLVDGQGKAIAKKAITFTVKSKTYTKITDANGLASLSIGLCVGTWSINIADPTTGAKTTAKVVITKART